MRKTTVYLPEDLKASLELLAAEEGRSEAEIIRQAIQDAVARSRARPPKVPLVERGLGDPTFAERVEELLGEFGRE